MPLPKITLILRMKATQYTAQYYKQNRNGKWRKFWFIGNTGVACDINRFLLRLGIRVIEEYYEVKDH